MPFNQKAAGRCWFQGHFIIEKIKSETLSQWQNISHWPFWDVTQTIFLWNYLSLKYLMRIKLQSSWQELILNFLLTETLLDRSKLKLLKTFCLFTFFFEGTAKRQYFALFRARNRCSDCNITYHIGMGIPFPDFYTLLCREILSGPMKNSGPKPSVLSNLSLEERTPPFLPWR